MQKQTSRQKLQWHLLAALSMTLLFFSSAFGATCEELATLKLPNTTITMAQSVSTGAFTPQSGSAAPYKDLPTFCRIAGVIRPTTDSEIKFEVWMPAANWNGKFHGIGNGGFAGSISYDGLAGALARGYASASTDTGNGGNDARWALGHPEKLADYGYRAIHEMTEKAKLVVKAFYGNGPKRSYFASCSNGGRQALMEAQRYPADYDGIIAGAPANAFTQILSGFAWNMQMLSDPASYFPSKKLKAIEAAVLAACDARDGVSDGVLDDPTKCSFTRRFSGAKDLRPTSALLKNKLPRLKRFMQAHAMPEDSRSFQALLQAEKLVLVDGQDRSQVRRPEHRHNTFSLRRLSSKWSTLILTGTSSLLIWSVMASWPRRSLGLF